MTKVPRMKDSEAECLDYYNIDMRFTQLRALITVRVITNTRLTIKSQ